MKFSKIYAISLKISIFAVFAVFIGYLSGCNSTTSPTYGTDEQYLQSVVTAGYDTNQTNDDNLMYNEKGDMDDGGAVGDNGIGGSAIDSLKRWGRIITDVNVNFQGSFIGGDTLYQIIVTRNITGYYRIIGWHNNTIDSVTKPYTETLNRIVVFKRVNRKPNPIFNWRLYDVSLLSGGTQTPVPNGASQSQIVGINITTPTNTINWPAPNGDFTQFNFVTLRFGGTGIPQVHIGDQVTINVTVNSVEQNNYVAWHWARNTFGFHRVPFTFVSSTPYPQGNGYLVVFTKTFTIYPNHKLGVFNGFINASTHESLYDDDQGKFASTEVGIPYRVVAP